MKYDNLRGACLQIYELATHHDRLADDLERQASQERQRAKSCRDALAFIENQTSVSDDTKGSE